jgi:hypothetical protein
MARIRTSWNEDEGEDEGCIYMLLGLSHSVRAKRLFKTRKWKMLGNCTCIEEADQPHSAHIANILSLRHEDGHS